MLFRMKDIKYYVISVVIVIATYFGTILFTKYAHELYLENMITRIVNGSKGVIDIKQVSDDDNFFKQTKSYLVTYRGSNLKFVFLTQSEFKPFYESNNFSLSNFDGNLLQCPYCNFMELRVEGNWKVNYITNTYNGMFSQGGNGGSKTNTKDGSSISISGISGDFDGAFSEHNPHVGIKIDNITNQNKETGFLTIIKRLVGDVYFEVTPSVILLNTRNFTMGSYESKNVASGEKIIANGTSISVTSSVENNLSQMNIDLKANAYEHNYVDWDRDLHLDRCNLNMKAHNVDLSFWPDFFATASNLMDYDNPNFVFNYQNLAQIQSNNSRIEVDRMQLVSKDSRGKLSIEKGSEIKFSSVSGDVKSSLDLILKFKINDAFFNDFPNGAKVRQQFVNNDWVVHGRTDAKDEYSSQLTVRSGHCSIGESEIEGC